MQVLHVLKVVHILTAHICYSLSIHGDAVSKSHYPHMWMRMQIAILGYADAVINNRIYIPFIYIFNTTQHHQHSLPSTQLNTINIHF
jgi:hypothetical protein